MTAATVDATPDDEAPDDEASSPAAAVWNGAGSRDRRHKKLITLFVIAGLALALRTVMVLVVHPPCPGDDAAWSSGEAVKSDVMLKRLTEAATPTNECFQLGGDPLSTVAQASFIANGHGMSSPAVFMVSGTYEPGAARPPAWTLVISTLDVLGLKTPTDARLMAALLGAAAVFVIGHVTWQLAGRTAGIAAALIAAFNPNLFINDFHLLNDGPYALVCALALLLAYRLWKRPGMGRAVALGAMVALGYYTRSESLLWLPFLVVPLIFGFRAIPWSKRILMVGAAGVVAILLVSPYWVFNATRFNQGNITLGSGVALLNASCDSTYYGDRIGMVGFDCFDAFVRVRLEPGTDESDFDVDAGAIGRRYVAANQRRLPYVAAVRVARIYQVWGPGQNAQYDVTVERRGKWEPWAGLALYYLLVPLTIAGLVHLRRRRIPISPFVGFFLTVTFTVALSFGLTRFRIPVDVGMCVLGGMGIAALNAWMVSVGREQRAGVREGGLATAAWQATTTDTRAVVQHVRDVDRRILAGIGVALVVVLAVLAWSGTAQPQPPIALTVDPNAANTTTTTAPAVEGDACSIIIANQEILADFTQHVTSGMMAHPADVVKALQLLETSNDPQVSADATLMRKVAEASRDKKISILDASNAGGPDARKQFQDGLQRLVVFAGSKCGGGGANPTPPTTAAKPK